jgi:hypothetical protein
MRNKEEEENNIEVSPLQAPTLLQVLKMYFSACIFVDFYVFESISHT